MLEMYEIKNQSTSDYDNIWREYLTLIEMRMLLSPSYWRLIAKFRVNRVCSLNQLNK